MTRTCRRPFGVAILFGGVAIVSLIVGIGFTKEAAGHALAPALLELREDSAGVVQILWKRSSLSVPGSRIEPVVPEDCAPISKPLFEKQGVAVLMRWAIDCGEQGLVGRPIRIDGLGPAKIDTLVRIQLADGRIIQRVLRRSAASMMVPARPDRFAVFRDYLTIGFEHILSGADHLLFVFGLFMLCAHRRALIQTVTSFTLGHSITLSLAALGYTRLPSSPIEVLIAGSVLVLAVELAKDEGQATGMRRRPWVMALLFGLLHGMGFAGALREVGLPEGEIPMALLSFNFGIELGQLAFVILLGGLSFLNSRLESRLESRFHSRLASGLPKRAAIYVMGSLAAYWVIERSARLF